MKVEEIISILNKHPSLKDRISSLLNLVENVGADDALTADAAEMRTITELRQMGSEIMHKWAKTKSKINTDAALSCDDLKKKK